MDEVEHIHENEESQFRIWTRNALIVSVVVHVIFGITAGFVVAIRSFHKPQSQFMGDPPPRPRLEPQKLEMKVKVQDLQKASARPKLQPRLAAASPSDIALPEIKKDPRKAEKKIKRNYSVTAVSGLGSGIGGGFGSGGGGGTGGGAFMLPTIMSGRCSDQDRKSRLKANGGSMSTERAVVDGLRWLKDSQNSNGSWGESDPAAMTGLALLAFLGHCETPESREFGKTVRDAIDYLVDVGKDNKGLVVEVTGNNQGHFKSYTHGIATYALAEAYSLTKESKIKSLLSDALEIIIDGQTAAGGWMYDYRGSGNDMSVASWQIQALEAGKVSGIKKSGLSKCLDQATACVKKAQAGNGGFAYQLGGTSHTETLTGAGTFALQMLGEGRKEEVKRGVAYLQKLNMAPNGKIYGYYYNTLASFQASGDAWKSWNKKFQDVTVDSQNKDGSWTNWNCHAKGVDGTVMKTSLSILMLEVYYRYSIVDEGSGGTRSIGPAARIQPPKGAQR